MQVVGSGVRSSSVSIQVPLCWIKPLFFFLRGGSISAVREEITTPGQPVFCEWRLCGGANGVYSHGDGDQHFCQSM